MPMSASERRRAFSAWLRTGRFPPVTNPDGVELKFNPWHDRETGRFTFAGAGQHDGGWRSGGFTGGGGGGGATGSGDWPRRTSQTQPRHSTSHAARQATIRATPPIGEAATRRTPGRGFSGQATWFGGGFTGGGDFGGGGATSRDAWGSAGSKHPPTPSPIVSSGRTATTSGASLRPTPTPNDEFRTVVRNGYTYQIDARDRTRHVFGALTIATVPVRSRTSQARAGGTERRVSDDGGHYIAARFHGPTEAFNHFAQDANVNRGKYRAMEDEWARDKRAGRTVRVKINPIFDGLSIRPSSIDVLWTVDGIRKSTKLRNDRSEKIRGK